MVVTEFESRFVQGDLKHETQGERGVSALSCLCSFRLDSLLSVARKLQTTNEQETDFAVFWGIRQIEINTFCLLAFWSLLAEIARLSAPRQPADPPTKSHGCPRDSGRRTHLERLYYLLARQPRSANRSVDSPSSGASYSARIHTGS